MNLTDTIELCPTSSKFRQVSIAHGEPQYLGHRKVVEIASFILYELQTRSQYIKQNSEEESTILRHRKL